MSREQSDDTAVEKTLRLLLIFTGVVFVAVLTAYVVVMLMAFTTEHTVQVLWLLGLTLAFIGYVWLIGGPRKGYRRWVDD